MTDLHNPLSDTSHVSHSVPDPSPIVVWKYPGETLHDLVVRVRHEQNIPDTVPVTYAGRLDPLAAGVMILLAGDDVHTKDMYSGLDKTYTATVVFGTATDTHDVLGLPIPIPEMSQIRAVSESAITEFLSSLPGTFAQTYPAYSSKTINGTPMWMLARSGELPEVLPTRMVTVRRAVLQEIRSLTADQLLHRVTDAVERVHGDFRQDAVIIAWREQLDRCSNEFVVATIEYDVSSGTYIRGLVDDMGRRLGTGATLLHLVRSRVGDITITEPLGRESGL